VRTDASLGLDDTRWREVIGSGAVMQTKHRRQEGEILMMVTCHCHAITQRSAHISDMQPTDAVACER
jgi:hypothetical protein